MWSLELGGNIMDRFREYLVFKLTEAKHDADWWSQQHGSSGNYAMAQDKVEILEDILHQYDKLSR
jgi:hypothetical protein